MKKALSILCSTLMLVAFLTACNDTAQVQDTPTVKSDMGGDDSVVTMTNSQVKDFSIDGFSGGTSKMKVSEDLENMKRIVGIVKPIIEKLPDGYAMQITGHAAAYPTKSLQNRVAKQRAYKIYSALKKAGVPAAKITYKGVGISEPLEGYDAKDFKQRRVSFKAIKK